MASSSLESKTIRPGSLGAYSYYHSARRPDHPAHASFIPASRHRLVPRKLALALVLIVIVALIAMPLFTNDTAAKKPAARSQTASKSSKTPLPAPAATAVAAGATKTSNDCAGNKLSKLVVVSISQRHMWACDGSKAVHDSPVITGISAYASTVTPEGTYHIYGKQTDTVLTGSDVTGSWSDPVSYWMPFLNNQYGTYGFHDATWRSNDAFGNTSPDSSDASHGCVELPLGTAQWLYGWVAVGTAVTIKG